MLKGVSANSLGISLWLDLQRQEAVLERVIVAGWSTWLDFEVAYAVEPILNVIDFVAAVHIISVVGAVLEQRLDVVLVRVAMVLLMVEVTRRYGLTAVAVQVLIWQRFVVDDVVVVVAIVLFVLDLFEKVVVVLAKTEFVLDKLVD